MLKSKKIYIIGFLIFISTIPRVFSQDSCKYSMRFSISESIKGNMCLGYEHHLKNNNSYIISFRAYYEHWENSGISIEPQLRKYVYSRRDELNSLKLFVSATSRFEYILQKNRINNVVQINRFYCIQPGVTFGLKIPLKESLGFEIYTGGYYRKIINVNTVDFYRNGFLDKFYSGVIPTIGFVFTYNL